ncbi:streptamidine family RiPP [Nocardiopsis chromatogenes]|uniref:streptamidine family RiPP n=1 Tax=Nocardiopsis chromatogenes TaxID=280239 RepID=UPI00034982C1|nr:streptamidine family RiPP [Nocardiopsis chromatogenes]
MDQQIATEVEESEQLAHLSASHSNALVANPFDEAVTSEIEESEQLAHLSASHSNALVANPFE